MFIVIFFINCQKSKQTSKTTLNRSIKESNKTSKPLLQISSDTLLSNHSDNSEGILIDSNLSEDNNSDDEYNNDVNSKLTPGVNINKTTINHSISNDFFNTESSLSITSNDTKAMMDISDKYFKGFISIRKNMDELKVNTENEIKKF